MFESLHSAERFHSILERERARADRGGDGFSLLVFSARRCPAEHRTLVELARILNRRLRVTDEAGWLGGRQIGVVLPGTSIEGAHTVADDALLIFPAGVHLPEFKVYRYPTDPISSEVGRPDGVRQRPVGEKAAHAMEALFVQPLPVWKRCLDVTGAAVGLVLLLPLFAVVAAAIKITSRGPVFFKQRRSGLGGKPFLLVKFRSMVVGADTMKQSLMRMNEQDGPAFKIKADPRVTWLGRLLRASSIDELPQVWNVLKGEMSLVGPRPLPCEESDACHGWERRRLDVTPGLTCIWQVKGRSRVTFVDWMRMDVQYIRSRSLRKDLKLLLQTVPALALRRGS